MFETKFFPRYALGMPSFNNSVVKEKDQSSVEFLHDFHGKYITEVSGSNTRLLFAEK